METEGGGTVVLNSNSDAVGGVKAKRVKVVKRDSVYVGVGVGVGVGASQNKILADVTNLHQQQPKQQVSAENLLKEKEISFIQSCKAELQKCQTNFQKLRMQNAELALTNSQMLAEVNSSRQKLRELQLELGIKNGILNAMKLELTEKEHTVNLKHETKVNEVNKQSDQSDNRGNAKRRRVFKPRSSAPAVSKQVKSLEKIDNQRYSLRRQSTGLKDEKPEPTEDFMEVVEVHDDISKANESGTTSLGSKVHDEARETTESSRPTNTEPIHTKKNIEKKRKSTRRQTNRFKPENPEPTEDLFVLDDAKFNVSQISDDMSEKCCPTSTITSGQENNSCSFVSGETRRSSVGRPLRRTVEKVVSYKEVPLNVKMRRDKSGNFIVNNSA
ncbi:SHUGOSHIN 2 isoform X2 [Vigna radiata var. radiata]|uniref:SHUGOSHIN 2 isoform X2 n=1 Tax=Vigna radiata var. radiata TaxID=3916 RepID=A0A1S3V2P0_VIGRR|nr:SHUGOSHIN 2 isoform X2 [Vigna radiata var. radiata]